MDSAIIKLNVGGVLYATTRSTLTKYPDSMLGAMFSGNIMPTAQDGDGNYFIDRNGKLFQYILDYLRNHEFIPPDESESSLRRLKAEADFYHIRPLIEAINNLLSAEQEVKQNVLRSPKGYRVFIKLKSVFRDPIWWYTWDLITPPDFTQPLSQQQIDNLKETPVYKFLTHPFFTRDEDHVKMPLVAMGAQPFEYLPHYRLHDNVFLLDL